MSLPAPWGRPTPLGTPWDEGMKPYKWFLQQDLEIYRISFGHRQLLVRPWPIVRQQNPMGDILQDWQLYGDVPPHCEHRGMRE